MLIHAAARAAPRAHVYRKHPKPELAPLNPTSRRISEETGQQPELFAYPYGEFDLTLRKRVAEAGFTAAFGQHSGVIHGRSHFYSLPRFSLNQQFGDLSRFQLVIRTLPLPVVDVTPSDPVLTVNPPAARIHGGR